MLSLSGIAAGCNSAEEQELATERVALLRAQNDVVSKNKGDCSSLRKGLADFEKGQGDRITSVNSRWTVLTDSKKKSLMKAHRDETDPYFKAMISPLISCGTSFPVK
jgi:hypothetical protein